MIDASLTEKAGATSYRAGRATAMLVVVCILWGLSFPWMKEWQNASDGCPGGELLSSLVMIALRMPVALACLAFIQPRLYTSPTLHEHLTGAVLGSFYFLGFLLQAWGVADTSPALSAFFTSLCSAWVPLLAWVCFRDTVAPLTLLGLVVGLSGTAVLGVKIDGGPLLRGGESLTLLASVVFAVQMILLDRLGKRVRSTHVTVGFFGAAALLSVLGLGVVSAAGPGLRHALDWTAAMVSDFGVLRNLLYMAIFPTTLAMYWMNTYQPRVSATRAALVYLLEPVFAAVFSVWWEHDAITLTLLLGGGLILAGNLLVEAPRWFGEVSSRSAREESSL